MGQPERATQNRVAALFRDELGYAHLGSWHDRPGNSNIEAGLLEINLRRRGFSAAQISRALHRLKAEADNRNRGLYENNKAVYGLLRYGVPVVAEAGQNAETVHLIDWKDPAANDFAVAEEVTLSRGGSGRRPDLVLYLNGIAVAVMELKNSRVSLAEGIRQLISNQRPEFNEWFFSTVQLTFAGNDSEGLRYGTAGTPEKYYLKWKEDEGDNTRYKLDKYLLKLAEKSRLLELIHDFILFDGGVKKVPRFHQYFGVKAAQAHAKRGEGGIIWHTQGSGKSIVMVLLAKWILENNPNARVAVITDRDELDKQIEGVFRDAGEAPHRSGSGRDLMAKLGQATPRLLCSLVHKFGQRGVENFDAFIEELKSQPSRAVGEVFVFVDECHRTQGGKLNKAMKALMPNAIFVGFTGTPLLKRDRQTTMEVFGRYIHTYKFAEAVEDEVVLDLTYEARDIDQHLTSQERIDAWFEAKTRGLNDWQKDELKSRWGTMQRLLSSRSRMDQIVGDIVFDFSVKPRLNSRRGTAILVAKSIYEACRYYTLFQETELRGKCALITSYNRSPGDVSREDTGENTDTEKEFVYKTYQAIELGVAAKPGKSKTESYEDEAKRRFIDEPANMRLLIVVQKLLTGFDAPSCTYLYLDKKMEDHGLFQAICRTNRLDGEDKDFGNIVDYMDLFKKVKTAIAVYSSEIDRSAGGATPEVLLKDRLKAGRERVESAVEALEALCESVEPPREDLQFIRYFCGNTEIESDLKEREPQRATLYKGVAALARAYANISGDLEEAGYRQAEADRLAERVGHYVKLRDTIRNASGERLDLKTYEADMRHLIDTYIRADEPRKISHFDNLTLTELIVKTGIADAIAERLGSLGANRGAVAETIENNVRSKIIKERLTNPEFFDKMSALLREIIADRKANAIAYEEYLKKIAELVKKVEGGHEGGETPQILRDRPALRALYDNLKSRPTPEFRAGEGAGEAPQYLPGRDPVLRLAIRIDERVREVKPDDFRGNTPKENVIKQAIAPLLGDDDNEVERLFAIIAAQHEY